MKKSSIVALIMTLIFGVLSITTEAEARKYRRHSVSHTQQVPLFNNDYSQPASLFTPAFGVRGPNTKAEQRRFIRTRGQSSSESQVVGGRPSGCPHAYCGCGASLYKFGRIIPELNLAWNWVKKFPRISMDAAGNGDAVVRRGHVAIILANLGGGNFKLHDSNSGRGLTRIHVRRVAGWVFVRPSNV